MPKGVYPRKPRRAARKRASRITAESRAATKINNAISTSMSEAAFALVNVARLRLAMSKGGTFTSANLISALSQGLGFSHRA